MGIETGPSRLGRPLAVPQMYLGQARPSERERGVEFDRPLISSEGLTGAFVRKATTIKPALEIILMRLHIPRAALFRRLHLRLNHRIRGAICKLTAQLSHDSLGELGLHGEHIFQIARVVFGPELLAR